MFRRLGPILARFVGLVMTILGTWIFVINLAEDSYSGGTRIWILTSAVLGVMGGVVYLLSFDGPDRFRTHWVRLLGWTGILVLAFLPWSFTFVVFPMVLLTIPTLFIQPAIGREEMVRGGDVFTVIRDGNETRILKDLGDEVRVEVVSRSADTETLLDIAEHMNRDAGRNR